MQVLVVFGTRPEAIKLGCVVRYLRQRTDAFTISTCVTGQHRELLDQVLKVFNIKPDYHLGLMKESQTLEDVTAAVLTSLSPILKTLRPDIVLVQGDTTTTLAAALAAFYAKIPVGHIEAGLRTPDKRSPFPEQMNRLLTTRLSDLHFAPTEAAKQNLLSEGVDPTSVTVTGNTVIDSLLLVDRVLGRTGRDSDRWSFLDHDRRLLLVTAHRRENFGLGLKLICDAIRRIAARSDVEIVLPIHPNPEASESVRANLSNVQNVHLIDALDYVEFVELLRRCSVVLTDSGGIQEEASALGRPTLILREQTERPEVVEAGNAVLVGTDPERIVRETVRLLEDFEYYRRAARPSALYGDGRASERIAEELLLYEERTHAQGQPTASASVVIR